MQGKLFQVYGPVGLECCTSPMLKMGIFHIHRIDAEVSFLDQGRNGECLIF